MQLLENAYACDISSIFCLCIILCMCIKVPALEWVHWERGVKQMITLAKNKSYHM